MIGIGFELQGKLGLPDFEESILKIVIKIVLFFVF